MLSRHSVVGQMRVPPISSSKLEEKYLDKSSARQHIELVHHRDTDSSHGTDNRMSRFQDAGDRSYIQGQDSHYYQNGFPQLHRFDPA